MKLVLIATDNWKYWTQRYVFEQQLILAYENKLPVIIHARESFHEIFAILDKLLSDLRIYGIFHSFSGSLADYRKIHLIKHLK